MIPSVAVAYTAFAVFLASVRLFANANVATAVFDQGSVLLAQVLFTPLLAGWSIWVGIAISTCGAEFRPLCRLWPRRSAAAIRPT
jgi:ABC-2 type transport system permease protein